MDSNIKGNVFFGENLPLILKIDHSHRLPSTNIGLHQVFNSSGKREPDSAVQ